VFYPLIQTVIFPTFKWFLVSGKCRDWMPCNHRNQIKDIVQEMATQNLLDDCVLIPFAKPLFTPRIGKSKIHDLGVFSTRNYDTSLIFGFYAPDCIPRKVGKGEGFQDYGIALAGGLVNTGFQLNGKLSTHYSIRFNHSFDPNIGVNANGSLQTLRPIKCDEEVTMNYDYKYWQAKLGHNC